MSEQQQQQQIKILTKYAEHQLHKEWVQSKDLADCVTCIEKAEELGLQDIYKELKGYLCSDEDGRNFWKAYKRYEDVDHINEKTYTNNED